MKRLLVFLSLSAILICNGCVTTSNTSNTPTASSPGKQQSEPNEIPEKNEKNSTHNYLKFFKSIFSPTASHLSKLIEEGKLKEADQYLSANKEYFIKNKKEQINLLQNLATSINNDYYQQFIDSIQKLSTCTNLSQENWPEIKRIIEQTEKLISQYDEYEIFNAYGFKSQEYSDVRKKLTELHNNLIERAPIAFIKFNHSTKENFFDLYPISLNNKSFFNNHAEQLEGFIENLSSSSLLSLKEKYTNHIDIHGSFYKNLSKAYFTKLIKKEKKPLTISKILNAVKKVKEAGLEPPKLSEKIAFIEATSKTLLNEGQIEFPVQVDMDIPLEPVKMEIDDIFCNRNQNNAAKYIIIFDVSLAKTTRRIFSKENSMSRYISGTISEPNPEYEIAKSKLFEAQSGLSNARSQYASGIAAAIAKGLLEALWATRVNNAQKTLESTPTKIYRDQYEPYKYNISKVKSSKALTVNYYVIDKIAKRYYKGSFDINETKDFRIAYNLHEKDPNKSDILNQYNTEDDIDHFEQSPVSVKTSLLIDDYLSNKSKSKPLKSLARLRKEFLRDKNKALTEYKKTQFTAKAVDDKRFSSVVVILTPTGKLGSGFYVTPDLVLTNYHVIEGSKFVEMKLFNGMETFGKVVKSDVRLDLALIKVQSKGAPIKIYSENTLGLGATVESIGHPKGLNFTITRGVISAVRKKPSIFASGGKKVMFVQTDAALNPGNSGGPLFLGDKVIGVNDYKVAQGSEGLGFAIHYSEILTFMKESF